ncbi:MAG: hypothetical protein A2Z65_13630 [Gallionellales bacterium RIFCSPLOWO2_02_58_13]|nr:MAG: hypothetical protein A2Z65_13630 [Gallionellales bacterium RIFCSPLOWO2_02_58_13]
MRTILHNAAAGSSVRFYELGSLFHLLETVFPVDIRFFKNGAIFAEATSMEGGFFSQPVNGFDAIEIDSANAQAVKFALSDGSGGYNRTTGAVQIIGQQGVMVQAAKEVTDASGQLLAANAARRMLLIQNNHETGIIYVAVSGDAATGAAGIKLAAGGFILLDEFVPSGAINAIGSILNNQSVVVVEG